MGSIRFYIYKLSKLLPKKQRKPLILFSNILGVFIAFNVMLHYTSSSYLLDIKAGFIHVSNEIFSSSNPVVILLILVAIIYLLAKRCWKQMQFAISFCYLIILILGILPYLQG